MIEALQFQLAAQQVHHFTGPVAFLAGPLASRCSRLAMTAQAIASSCCFSLRGPEAAQRSLCERQLYVVCCLDE
jgi:hypothetical protein